MKSKKFTVTVAMAEESSVSATGWAVWSETVTFKRKDGTGELDVLVIQEHIERGLEENGYEVKE